MEKVRFRCNKILPTVYDDSLSYYESICKLVGKVNELVEYTNTKLEAEIEGYIRENLGGIFADMLYDENTKTIYFNLEERA